MIIATIEGTVLGFRYPSTKTGEYFQIPPEGLEVPDAIGMFALSNYPTLLIELESLEDEDYDDSEEVIDDIETIEGDTDDADSVPTGSENVDGE